MDRSGLVFSKLGRALKKLVLGFEAQITGFGFGFGFSKNEKNDAKKSDIFQIFVKN